MDWGQGFEDGGFFERIFDSFGKENYDNGHHIAAKRLLHAYSVLILLRELHLFHVVC